MGEVITFSHSGRTRCQRCKGGWNRLFDVFVNGLGWVRRCGACADPRETNPPAPPRGYTGPYPIRSDA